MNRRTYKILIIISGLLVIGAGTYILIKHPFRAETPVAAPVPYLATVTVQVAENGQAGSGTLSIGGDCPNRSVPSQQGTFTCKLTDANAGLQLTGITYQSFISNKRYSLPIIPRGTIDPRPIVLAPNTTLKLLVQIDSKGTLTLKQLSNGSYTVIDPNLGLVIQE